MLILKLLLTLAQAAQLSITNNTQDNIRILFVESKCIKENLVAPAPAIVKPGSTFILNGLEPVIYTYELCGLGLCVQSAVGMNDKINSYTLSVIPDKMTVINTKAMPDIWPGNLECK